jgi:hemolysin III
MHNRLSKYLLEPINAITHLFGAAVSLIGTLILLYLTWGQPGKSLSFAIYGLSMTFLYAASALLHGAKLADRNHARLNRLDHAAIFIMIAGTFTPIIYNLFPPNWRWSTLIGYWLIALGGMLYKLISPNIHSAINKPIYPILCWGGVIPAVLASRNGPIIPMKGLALILLGGLVYMLGFIIYYRQRPNPIPGIFGHHEIWHLLVLVGSFAHYLFMLLFIVPTS